MKIDAPQANKIVVELTAQDMAELDITYEELDYGNIETRRVIWTILDRVRTALHRDIDPSEKMLIESVPTQDGGCVLFFTVPRGIPDVGVRQPLHICKQQPHLLCVVDAPETLFRLARHLRQAVRPLPESSLYLWEKRYVLLLQNCACTQICRMIVSEYGTVCADNTLALAVLREHGKLLAERDAIEKLTIGG